VAGKARDADKRTGGTETQAAEPGGAGQATAVAQEVRPEQPAEGRFEGQRSATVNLPFMTAQFRAPNLHTPTREDLDAAARGARSMLPSGKSLLFYGGLAATAVAGVIEWPVAAAIGIGSAMASRGAANPAPRGGPEQPVQAETSGTSQAETSPRSDEDEDRKA
jgi:hypothetical protein